MAEENKQTESGRHPIEKHMQTAIQVFLTALCIWMANTVNDSSIELAKQGVRMESMKTQITSLQEGNKDRYPATQAAKDFNVVNNVLDDLLIRVRELEKGK